MGMWEVSFECFAVSGELYVLCQQLTSWLQLSCHLEQLHDLCITSDQWPGCCRYQLQVITQLDMESLHAFEWLAVDITIIQHVLAYALVGELTVALFIALFIIMAIGMLSSIDLPAGNVGWLYTVKFARNPMYYNIIKCHATLNSKLSNAFFTWHQKQEQALAEILLWTGLPSTGVLHRCES